MAEKDQTKAAMGRKMIDSLLTKAPGIVTVGLGYMIAAAADLWLGTTCLKEIREMERILGDDW